VGDHLARAADGATTWYHKCVHQKQFAAGDAVMVHSLRRYKGRTPKWQSFYKDVRTIVHKLKDVTYIVKCATWKQNKVVHVDKLKPLNQFN